ncbi:unnamed protein product [Brassica oleracea var. botrytis]|uniref:Transposase MuDR plant domain-containing protein n=1 Tax=Brassica oleracea TaxID=3712 RepID=A0A3P6BY83_BRAOL|nr:unnamed protein product [Brassica oleracea]
MLNDLYTPALFGKDAPPVFNDRRGTGVDTALADIQYEGDDIYVGHVFKSKTDCKIKLAIHAMNRKFHFRTPRSSPAMLLSQCVGIGCPWRVYAVLLDASGKFQVRQAKLIHSCTVDERCNYHKLATTQVIGEIMQSRFVGIKRGPTAATIRKILLDEFHVNVSYWKAWRARELAMDHAMGTMVGSYSLIPAYLALLQSSNEGTTCFLQSTDVEDGGTRFKYFFCCIWGINLRVSVHAQSGCCRWDVIEREVWWLPTYSVCTKRKFPNRHANIYSGLRKIYHHAHRVACVVHLWRNIKATFKKSRLANLMSAAARTFTVTEFNQKFIEIQKINHACVAYLVDIGFDHWTRAHFKASALRRAKANREQGTLTPNAQKLVEENYDCQPVYHCMEYNSIGIPCIHALATATRIGFPSDALVAPPYYVTTWRQGYAGKIYPVPSVGGIEIGSGTPNDLLPPTVRRPPGRPRKVCILSRRKKEAPHPLGNANVVAVQVTTRRPAVTLYKKYVTMEKAYEGSSKLLLGNWVNKRKPLPSTDWPSK